MDDLPEWQDRGVVCRVRGRSGVKQRLKMRENEGILGQGTPGGDSSMREEQGRGGGVGGEGRRTGELRKAVLRARRGNLRALISNSPKLWNQR